MPILSVVVPIFKVEKFLEQCLDSLVRQTLKDIEIILVDDGSPDKCGDIADNWSKKDTRIKVIHQKNAGYGTAVNNGMKNASGKYVSILEPDDWIEDSMYEKLVLKAEEDEVEIARCGFYVYDSRKQQNQDDIWFETSKLIQDAPNGAFSPMNYRYIFDVHSAIWTYIFRRDFLIENQISLDSKRKSYQDMPFIFDVLSQCNTMSIVKEYLYHYRVEPNQGSSSTGVSVRAMDIIDMCELSQEILRKNGKLEALSTEFYRHCIQASKYFYDRTPVEYQRQFLLRMHDFFVSCPYDLAVGLSDAMKEWYSNTKRVVLNRDCPALTVVQAPNVDDVNVCYCFDAGLYPYFSVSLLSLIQSSGHSNYNIYIISDHFDAIDLGKIRSLVVDHTNIRIHFIDMTQYEARFNGLFIDRHLTQAAYWRFFLPEILSNVEKVVYLDCDTLVCDDIAELFHISLKENYLAGCIDQAAAYFEYGDFKKSHDTLRTFGYTDFSRYVNSGILLLNLSVLREKRISQRWLEAATKAKFPFHDQDVINLVCKDHVQILDEKWNFTTHVAPDMYSTETQKKMYRMIESWNIGIIHYPGAHKPWNSDVGLLSWHWWKIAKNSPYFCKYHQEQNRKNEELIFIPNKKIGIKSMLKRILPDYVWQKLRVIKYACYNESKIKSWMKKHFPLWLVKRLKMVRDFIFE